MEQFSCQKSPRTQSASNTVIGQQVAVLHYSGVIMWYPSPAGLDCTSLHSTPHWDLGHPTQCCGSSAALESFCWHATQRPTACVFCCWLPFFNRACGATVSTTCPLNSTITGLRPAKNTSSATAGCQCASEAATPSYLRLTPSGGLFSSILD